LLVIAETDTLLKGGPVKRFNLILLSMLILVYAVLFSACEKERPDVVATVGPEKITVDELRDAYTRKAQLLGVNSITPEMKRDVLDLMIERAVVHQYALQQGMKVSQDKLQERTSNLKPEELETMKKDIQRQLLIEQARAEIVKDVGVSNEDVENYYQEHKEEFSLPERYKVYIVKVKEERAAHVLQEAKQDPAAFDDMALNTSSAELRQINKNARLTPKESFPEEMWQNLKKMKKGSIAGPVEAARGMFLYKLIDREPAHLQSIEEVSSRIKHFLLEKKKDEEFNKWFGQEKERFPVKMYVQDLESLDR
jgi:parvulin-like peptidyl-prolyl isomerase